MMVPGGNSENGSTGRSAHDDGYGTESGSNQKVHTVSKKFIEPCLTTKSPAIFTSNDFWSKKRPLLLPYFFDTKDDLLLLP